MKIVKDFSGIVLVVGDPNLLQNPNLLKNVSVESALEKNLVLITERGGKNDMAIKWTGKEIRILKEKYRTCSNREVRSYFPERSWRSVQRKAEDLNLTRPIEETAWTEGEIAIVIEGWFTNKPQYWFLEKLAAKK